MGRGLALHSGLRFYFLSTRRCKIYFWSDASIILCSLWMQEFTSWFTVPVTFKWSPPPYYYKVDIPYYIRHTVEEINLVDIILQNVMHAVRHITEHFMCSSV